MKSVYEIFKDYRNDILPCVMELIINGNTKESYHHSKVIQQYSDILYGRVVRYRKELVDHNSNVHMAITLANGMVIEKIDDMWGTSDSDYIKRTIELELYSILKEMKREQEGRLNDL